MLQRYEKYEGRRNKELDAIKELFGCDFAEVNEKLEKAQKDMRNLMWTARKAEKLERKLK